jgi:hypothetical protein
MRKSPSLNKEIEVQKGLSTVFAAIIVALIFVTETVAASEIIPQKLISLSQPLGNKIFARSYSPEYFWPLNLNFVTQDNTTYCSVASSVMVLNAMNIEPPKDPQYLPFKTFSQNNFFTHDIEKVLPSGNVKKEGATLDQLGHALSLYPVSVKLVHADEITKDQFRNLARNIIEEKSGYIIVNFSRPALGEKGEGHMSPIAAYDKFSDRVLILDVARYRYPPVWVNTADLWYAMHTVDSTSQKYRGLIVLSKK